MPEKFDSYTIEDKGGDVMPFCVYGWGVYDSGVLAGQTRKAFVESYASEGEARAAFPGADEGTHRRSAGNTFNHLPGEDDPVSGGAYPDDHDDGI
jgi:hypothetical protein